MNGCLFSIRHCEKAITRRVMHEREKLLAPMLPLASRDQSSGWERRIDHPPRATKKQVSEQERFLRRSNLIDYHLRLLCFARNDV
jgi:hypothetical protein